MRDYKEPIDIEPAERQREYFTMLYNFALAKLAECDPHCNEFEDCYSELIVIEDYVKRAAAALFKLKHHDIK